MIGVGEIGTGFERVNRIWQLHRAESRFQGCRFGFDIWTTGLFDKEALALLKVEKAKRKDIEINWRVDAEVRDYAKQASRKAILDPLDEHYFKHPLRSAR